MQADAVEIDASSPASSERWKADLFALELDFFLVFGEENCALDVTDAARYGAWYFLHGDVARHATSAPGFWEIYRNEDVTGAALLQRTNDDAAGIVLKSGYLPTVQESFEQNVEAVFAQLPKWPARVCRDINAHAAGYFDDAAVPHPAAHYDVPNALQIRMLRLLERRNALAKRLASTLYSTDWSIGRIEGTPNQFIGRDTQAQMTHLYPSVKGKFLADPCVFTRASRTYLLSEEYRYDTKRGTIVGSELLPTGATPPLSAIEEPRHLSYPHVFEHDGAVYCIPGSESDVRLYRSVELPHRWEYVRTLVTNFAATDSTLVRYEEKWWLFCTSGESGKRAYNSHLYIWHADELFGPWTPHILNPVKIDARSARPAGAFFMDNNRLYRPAQDCSRGYGGSLRINRIDKLSEREFHETVVGIVRPPAKYYTKGIHTISSAGAWCVVDAKRYVFEPAGVVDLLKLAARSIALRLGVRTQRIESVKRQFAGRRGPVASDFRRRDNEESAASPPTTPGSSTVRG
ncbi:MAG: hypothetical protein ABR591_02005 [Candidatus Velthaea sp.]